jgi:fructose-bisphosphate aldolase class I
VTAQALRDTAWELIGGGKGLLAMDESTPTRDKRFAGAGIPQADRSGHAGYRAMVSSRSDFEASL